jgi:hypothetical protein
VTKKKKEETRKFLECNESENTTYQTEPVGHSKGHAEEKVYSYKLFKYTT